MAKKKSTLKSVSKDRTFTMDEVLIFADKLLIEFSDYVVMDTKPLAFIKKYFKK